MFFSFFIQTGPASGGWTAYPPINGLRDTGVNLGSGLGFDLWILGMTLFICIIFIRWVELYSHGIEHAYKRYEHVPYASYYVGA
jgi:heme/copper-type cytochrome/quinol oxidase subunit 1